MTSAIYRKLPLFYRNFSVMLLFKIFICPQRKSHSLPSLSLGTMYGVCPGGGIAVHPPPKKLR